MKTLRERLRYVLDLKQIKQSELARKAQVSQSNIACILNGRNKSTNPQALGRMAAVLGVSLAWLAGSSDEDFPSTAENLNLVNILYYDFVNGELIATNEVKAYNIQFFKEHNINNEKCKLLKVPNDAMEPLLYKGDTVLVNCDDVDPFVHDTSHVYALTFKNQLFIRRLVPSFNSVQIQSLNSSYPTQTISESEFKESFKVIGRVVDKFGNGGL